MKLQIEYVKTEELKAYENNAKLHPAEQIEQIKKSVEQFGMNDPIAIWKDNVIIEGHGRLIACQELGFEEVPVIRLDSLTDEQRKAYTLVHNKITMNSGFDFNILNEELDNIFDINMEDFGFDLDSIATDFDETEIEEDEVPDEVETRCKKGDIWKLGEHRLMCGDSTIVNDVEKLMNGNKSDMVFTDPPYGYNYQSNKRTKTDKFDIIANDDVFLDFFPNIKLFNKGFVFVCTTWKVIKEWIELFENYYPISNMIIWDKGGGGIGDLKHTFFTDYEIILCSNNEREIIGKRIGSVWKCGKDSANDYVHPTQKPVELSSMAIKNVTKKNDIVLDLFGGSGSTLIACEQLNRKCYMMEFDEHYCDVIIQRWENLTGLNAELLS